jgi:hypothetical protein
MKAVAVLFFLQGLPIVLALFAFIYQRARWRRKKRSGKRRGFYPTAFALGIAFQQIQLFVAPDAKHTIQEMLKEEAEADDDGGPDDPARHLDRQLRRIRRGEQIETLTTLLPDRE